MREPSSDRPHLERVCDPATKGRRNVELLRHDIVRDALPLGAFDLIHARHVFVHLPNAAAILPKLKAALKPGGWLVIEDFDPVIDRTALITDRNKAEALDRVVDAIWRLFAKHGGTSTNWVVDCRHTSGSLECAKSMLR